MKYNEVKVSSFNMFYWLYCQENKVCHKSYISRYILHCNLPLRCNTLSSGMNCGKTFIGDMMKKCTCIFKYEKPCWKKVKKYTIKEETFQYLSST